MWNRAILLEFQTLFWKKAPGNSRYQDYLDFSILRYVEAFSVRLLIVGVYFLLICFIFVRSIVVYLKLGLGWQFSANFLHFLQKYRCVPKIGFSADICICIFIDILTDIFIDISIHICIDILTDIFIDILTDRFIDMFIDISIDDFIDILTDICIDISIDKPNVKKHWFYCMFAGKIEFRWYFIALWGPKPL